MLSASPPKRLTLVIASLGSGGAQRVLLELAQHWAGRGHDITLITLTGTWSDFYPVPEGVRRIPLDLYKPTKGLPAKVASLARRVSAVRRALKESRPDAILSFMDSTNVLTLLASACLGCPVFVSERAYPTSTDRMWHFPRRLTYPFATQVVVQTQGIADWFVANTRCRRLPVIANPVHHQVLSLVPKADVTITRGLRLVSVGRLVPQKGYPELIAAVHRAAKVIPDISLDIYGEGPLDKGILELVQGYGLEGQIRLKGTSSNIPELLRGYDAFVLASHFEGFPNVLLEALCMGLPSIATDCPTGPRELLAPISERLLVPCADPGSLANAIVELGASYDLRLKCSLEGIRLRDTYSRPSVLSHWENLFNKAGVPL